MDDESSWGFLAEGSRQKVVVEECGSTYDCFLIDDHGGWHELDPGHGMRWGFASKEAAIAAAERKLGEKLLPEN